MDNKSDFAEKSTIFTTQNVYLTAFLISHPEFSLGRVEIKDLTKSNIADLEVKYEAKYKSMLENFIDLFKKGKAIVNLTVYQKNIRFVMHLVNQRKSGINGDNK